MMQHCKSCGEAGRQGGRWPQGSRWRQSEGQCSRRAAKRRMGIILADAATPPQSLYYMHSLPGARALPTTSPAVPRATRCM